MDIYDKVAYNVLYYMDELSKSEKFIRAFPDMTIFEYICAKTNITPKRLAKILEIGAKRKTRIDEVYRISIALGMNVNEIISNEVK